MHFARPKWEIWSTLPINVAWLSKNLMRLNQSWYNFRSNLESFLLRNLKWNWGKFWNFWWKFNQTLRCPDFFSIFVLGSFFSVDRCGENEWATIKVVIRPIRIKRRRVNISVLAFFFPNSWWANSKTVRIQGQPVTKEPTHFNTSRYKHLYV